MGSKYPEQDGAEGVEGAKDDVADTTGFVDTLELAEAD